MDRLQDSIEFLAPAPDSVEPRAQRIGTPGNNKYYYWVVAYFPIGVTITTDPAYLVNAPNQHSYPSSYVIVDWDNVPGALSYDVLRTNRPTFPRAPGNYAVAKGVSGGPIDDYQDLQPYDPSALVGLPWGAPAARYIRLNNRDYTEPTLELPNQTSVTTLIFADGTTQDTAGGGGGGAVSSVFGRVGDVVAQDGDYTAAQITNAVDQTQSYANPDWIASLDASKITNIGSLQTPWLQNIDGAGFQLSNAGNVGIGTPASNFNPLTIVSSNPNINNMIDVFNTAAGDTGGSGIRFVNDAFNSALIFVASSNYYAPIQQNSLCILMQGGNLYMNATMNILLMPNSGQAVGINNTAPAYMLDVVGDINITGVYRVNGVPISTGGGGQAQTPWLSNIDAAQFSLSNIPNISNAAGDLVLSSGVDGGWKYVTVASGWFAISDTSYDVVATMEFRHNNLARWQIGKDNRNEPGNNTGGNFIIQGFSDAGTYLNPAAILVQRSTNFVGINLAFNTVPNYTLDVVGNINTSGNYLVNGTPLALGPPQTPWLSNIDGANHTLKSVTFLGVGNDLTVFGDANTSSPHAIIGSNASGSSNLGYLNLITNRNTTNQTCGVINFSNLAATGMSQTGDYTLATITAGCDGNVNAGYIQIATRNPANGFTSIRIRITSLGNVGINQNTPAYTLDVGGDCNITGVYRVNGTPFSSPVTSVFTRTGAIVAATGDYTAAQVTNAVDSTGSYANPSWLASLAWGKITGTPSVSSYQTPWLSDIDAAGHNLVNASGLTCSVVHANGNVLYMANDSVYWNWDGTYMYCNQQIRGASNIMANGNLYANSNWLYFASGAVAIYWDGTWIHHTHNIYTDQSIQAAGTVTASGTMSCNGNVYYMSGNGVYMTWNGSYIAFSHGLNPPDIVTNWIAVGGAGAVGNSVNVTGNYYINGAPLALGITGVNWQQNEVGVSTRPTCDFYQVSNIVFYVTDDPGSNRVRVYATQVSDARLKENIVPLEGGMSVIRQLQPVEFDYNGLGGTRKGVHSVSLIAQELQQVLPNSVTTFQYKLNPSDEETTNLLTFDSNVITYQTVLAVQELEKRIEVLEARV